MYCTCIRHGVIVINNIVKITCFKAIIISNWKTEVIVLVILIDSQVIVLVTVIYNLTFEVIVIIVNL